MFYSYESGGRVSRPVFDYRTEVLSGSFAARSLESFKFIQGPAVPLSDIGGTLAQYADRSIYNLVSQRSGLGVLSGAQTSQQQVPDTFYIRQVQSIHGQLMNLVVTLMLTAYSNQHQVDYYSSTMLKKQRHIVIIQQLLICIPKLTSDQ